MFKNLIRDRRPLDISTQLALLALFTTVGIFAYSLYTNEVTMRRDELTYSEQLTKELHQNLEAAKKYEQDRVYKVDDMTASSYKVYTRMVVIVYETGLQNGMVLKLPKEAQESLAGVYRKAELLNSMLDNYQIDEIVTKDTGLMVKNVIIPAVANEVNYYAERVNSGSLVLNDSRRTFRYVTGIASTLVTIVIICQLVLWLSNYLSNKGRRRIKQREKPTKKNNE